MGTTTTLLALYKPALGESGYDDEVNNSFDIIDAAFGSTTASGTDTYTATISPAITAYKTGLHYFITFTNANLLTTSTINLNAIGAKTIKLPGGGALVIGSISTNHPAILKYDGTDMILLNSVIVSVASKIITTTHELSAGSGTLVITGVGFKPSTIIVFGTLTGDTNAFWGVVDNAKTGIALSAYTLTSNYSAHDSFFRAFTGTAGSVYSTFTVTSYDTDGFTLNIVKTGSPTGLIYLKFICIR